MLNCIKQLFIINTHMSIIIRDNNYVVSNFKEKGLKLFKFGMRVGLLRNLGMLYRESTQLKITIILLLIVLIGKSLTVKLLQLRKKVLLLQECLGLIVCLIKII